MTLLKIGQSRIEDEEARNDCGFGIACSCKLAPVTPDIQVRVGIGLANERLGVLGKLSTVSALHFEEVGLIMDGPMEATQLREVWFWQAEEGLFLKPPPRPPPSTGALDGI